MSPGRHRSVVVVLLSFLTVLAASSPLPVQAANTGFQFSKTVSGAAISPVLTLTLAVDHASAIPADVLTYSGKVANTGDSWGITGRFTAESHNDADASVASWWDEIQYCLSGCGDGLNKQWTALAGAAGVATGYTPVTPADISTGLQLTAVGRPASGVVYPTAGDQLLGTTVTAGATAIWDYSATVALTPSQVALLADPTKVQVVRNVAHLETSGRNFSAAQPWTDSAIVTNGFQAAAAAGNATAVTVNLTEPGGTVVKLDSTAVPGFASIPPGGILSYSTRFTVPVPAAKGATETDADYLQRLGNLDGVALTASATLTATGSAGATTAPPPPPVTTIEHLALLGIVKTGPTTIDAGTTEANPLAISNSGSAPASNLAVLDSVPGGATGTVSVLPATLAPKATIIASAAFPIPVGQPAGPLTDTAALTWTDANGNAYGPVSSSFTTAVHNNFFGASLTLTPAVAGPNKPGTTQTLTAKLLNGTGVPMANQPLTFTVTGANPGTGSATTDSGGMATFTYTGNNVGTDVAQATVNVPGVNLASNTSSISWVLLLQPVAMTPVTGNFFTNAGPSCTFLPGPGTTPVFSQQFPDILFNPATAQVPHNISGVTQSTRPFTDLTTDVNGNYNGTIVAQDQSGNVAGMGSLGNFYAELTGSFVIQQAGDVTLTVTHSDGYLLGVGGGATRVSGAFEGNPPATTPFNSYPTLAAWNMAAGTPASDHDSIHFPAPGVYPFEIDYTQCGPTALTLVIQLATFTAQNSPLSIYVGYADGLRGPGSIFPFPWDGSPDVTFVGGGQMDSGAIRFDNSGDTPINIDTVTVDVGNNAHYDVWPHSSMVVPPHKILILAQTNGENFDSSDVNGTGCGQDSGIKPVVHVTSGTTTTSFTDSQEILNTHGYDTACQGNESESWVRIGGGGTAINVPLPPAGTLNLSPFNVPNAIQGQPLALTVAAMDGSGNAVANLPITLQVYGANARTLNANSDAAGLAHFTYTGVSGKDTLVATGFVSGLREVSNTGTVVWAPPVGGGPNPNPDPNAPPAPTIGPLSIVDGSVVTKPITVSATVTAPPGQTITSWRVFYVALDPGPLVVIGSGIGAPPAPPAVLATFDPTVLVNDNYGVTVEATASGGGIQDLTSSVAVAGNLKPGRYETTSQDLHAPVNGFQIQVLRSYDSLDKSVGDFGVGWRLSLADFRTAPSRVLGAGGWTQYNKQCFFGLCLTGFRNAAPRYVTVTFPDQHTEVFDFTPTGGTNLFWDGAAAFTARPGTGTLSTLLALDSSLSYTGDGNLYGSNGLPYDPQRFQLTTVDGRVIVLDRTLGLVSETDPNGNSLTVSAAGVVSSGGPSITFDRDSLGRVVQVHGPAGELIKYAYSTAGDLNLYTDANGNLTTFAYDAAHDLTSVSGPNGPVQTLSYQGGRLVSVTDGNGNTSLLTNDAGNQKQTVLDPNQQLTSVYTYDDLGDVIQLDRTFSGTTLTDRFTYDAIGHVLTHRDALGQQSTAQYDASGNLVGLTDANGSQFHYTYNTLGQVLSVLDPSQAVVQSYVYDAHGNRVEWDRADGSKLLYQHNAAGLTTQVTDSAGRITRYTYDANGHLSGVTDNGGNHASVVSDAAGRVTRVTDGNGKVTSYSYDQLGDLTNVVDDGGRHWVYRYDFQSRLTAIQDPLGAQRSFTYDAAGLLSQVIDRDGRTINLVYDADGRLASKTLPSNQVTTYTRDPLGQLIEAANANSDVRFTFDAGGRMTQTSSAGTPTSSQPSVTLAYTYDANGNKTTLTGPDGQTRFGYDIWSQLTSVIDPAGHSFALGRDSSFRLTSLQRPDGVTDSLTYDAGDALLGIASVGSSGTVASLSYGLDANGRASSLTNGAGTTAYTRDAVGQLTSATYPSGFPNDTFQYDGAGNRISSTAGASTYDGAGRLISGPGIAYRYDGEGDLQSSTDAAGATTSYTFNADHQLLAIHYPDGTVTTYRYDPFGRRIEINDGTKITRYVYDGDSIHLEYGGTNQLQASFVDGPTADYVLEMVRGAQPYYYLRDQLGSTTALVDGTGAVVDSYRYSAFGSQAATGTVDNPFTFTGREYDAKSGLYYFRARWYDPRTGRFLSEDPVPAVNLYPYAFNDPVTYNDPKGEQASIEYRITCSEDEEVFVYVARENSGKCYVGITNNLGRRFAQHGGFGRFANWAALNIPGDGLTRLGARGLEQSILGLLGGPGGAGVGGGVGNVINSISTEAEVYGGATGFGDGLVSELDLMAAVAEVCAP